MIQVTGAETGKIYYLNEKLISVFCKDDEDRTIVYMIKSADGPGKRYWLLESPEELYTLINLERML